MAVFELSYSYMDMISLQNVMEKQIYYSITIFLFKSLKLIFTNYCTISHFMTASSVLNSVVSYILEQLYKNVR